MFHVFPPPLLFRGPLDEGLVPLTTRCSLAANNSIIFGDLSHRPSGLWASVAHRFSSDPNPRNVQWPLGQSFGMFGNTWRITFTNLFIVFLYPTSPWGWSDPWNLSAEQSILSAWCFGLHEGPSTWCDLGRSSPSSWEQTLYGQTTKQSCCPWNQVVKWSPGNRRSRQKWTCGWEKWKTQQWRVRMRHDAREWKNQWKDTFVIHPMRLEPDGSILNHTRWNIACTKCAVCTTHRLHGNRCCSWTKTWKKKHCAQLLHPFKEAAIVSQRFCNILENCTHISCRWPPWIGRWRSGSRKLPPISRTWTLIDEARNKIPCAWCMLIGWTCCGVTCGNFIYVAGTVALGAVGFEDRVE